MGPHDRETLTRDPKTTRDRIAQHGVNCVVFGVKNFQELEKNLKYISTSEKERSYEEISLLFGHP